MSDQLVLMGSFSDNPEPVADALDGLRALGIPDSDISILSPLPFSSHILGRPPLPARLGKVALISAAVGLATGLFFTVVSPYLYVIRVGGQPIVPTPPTLLLLYEFTMLFLIVGTFGGFVVMNRFPDRTPEPYEPSVSDGHIGVVVKVPAGMRADVEAVLQEHGAGDIQEPARRVL